MACTVDHLRENRRVTVLRGFRDARGAPHEAGESGVIQSLRLDWSSQQILLEWRRGGIVETLAFDLLSKSGPGNGRMREYFEVGEEVGPEQAPKVSASPTLPPLAEVVIRDRSRRTEALDRVWALAGRKRFEEAREQLLALEGPSLDGLAAGLTELAERHALDDDPAVYEWLREQAINHWYAWGSGATSGGDGAARLLEIKPAMARLQRLDRERELRSQNGSPRHSKPR